MIAIAKMPAMRCQSFGWSFLNESAMEIRIRPPPYMFIAMIRISAGTESSSTIAPKLLKMSSPVDRMASIVPGAWSAIGAAMIAPIQNIHVPAITSGQYVHMNVLFTPALAGRYRE